MVTADLVRAGLVAVMAVPGLPLPVLLALLVAVNVLESPFNAARAALVPDVTGDRYLTALVTDRALQQTAQVLGFAGSGLLLLVCSPATALLVDAASFAVSAVLLRRWVHHRPAADTTTTTVQTTATSSVARPRAGVRWRVRLRRAGADAATGWDTIWSTPATRRAVLLTWLVSAFAIVPEGLAAPWPRPTPASCAGGPSSSPCCSRRTRSATSCPGCGRPGGPAATPSGCSGPWPSWSCCRSRGACSTPPSRSCWPSSSCPGSG